MCSISGFYDPTADFTGQRDSFLHILDEMKHCLAHRGPDDNDSLLTPHCGLAHTRLSIIDLAGQENWMAILIILYIMVKFTI